MKKALLIIVAVAMTAVVCSSCGKTCTCTRYEDGKAIASYTDKETKFFENKLCTNQSVSPYEGTSSTVEGKAVTVEYKCK